MGQLKLPGIAGSRPNVRRCLAAWVRPNSLAASGAACGCKSRLRLQKPLVAVKATCSCKSHLWLQKPLVAAKATCSNQSHLRLQKSLAAEKSLVVAAKATCGCKSHLRLQKSLAADKTTRNNQSRLCGVRPWPARVGRRKTCVKPPRASCAMQLGIQAIAFHAPRVR